MPLIRRDPPAPVGDGSPRSSDLKSVDPDARRRAVRSLGHDRQAVPVLMGALEGESDPAVLEAIFTALEAIPDAALPLTSLLRSDDAGLRNDAVEALQAMPDAVRPLLPGLLADRDADVRILSVEVARCLPAEEMAPLLRGLLIARATRMSAPPPSRSWPKPVRLRRSRSCAGWPSGSHPSPCCLSR